MLEIPIAIQFAANFAVIYLVYFNTIMFARRNAKRAILKRTKNPNTIKKVVLPPELKQVKIPKHLDVSSNAKEISYFINTLRKQLPKDCLDNLYRNIQSVDIKNNFLIAFGGASGTYSQGKNAIRLIGKDSIYHELFHMASAAGKSDHIGFAQYIQGGTFGRGINEGYTELLTRRYFGDKIDPNHIKDSGYNVQVSICRKLEKIVGKDKMTKLYLTANLKGLIDELKKYATEEEIYNFIYGMDTITQLGNSTLVFKLPEVQKAIKYISRFLIKVHFKYLSKQLELGKIDEIELYKQHKEFVESYEKTEKFYYKEYSTFNDDDLREVFSEIMEEQSITR